MADAKQLHIAMFPWLAFGHMIPYFELAKRIAQRGHRISFMSTPRNIQRLPKVPPNLSSQMNFVSLTLPHHDNLPHDAEATNDLPFHKIPYLKISCDKLQDSLAEFLQKFKPDWIIYDFIASWLPPITAKLGISSAFFSIFQAWSLCFGGSSSSAMINGKDPRTKLEDFTVPPPWVPFKTNVAFRLHEAKKIFDLYEMNDSGVTDMVRAGSVIDGCDVIAVRSCMEIELQWISLLGELHGKPVLPVGLLPPTAYDNRDTLEDNNWLTINDWLGKHEPKTVIYVAFGSELNLSQIELTELALGLELSGLPFFWALRNRDDTVVLPDGFEERVKGRGVVCTSWAPQLRILAHESVGAFLTHCGFSSVTESLYYGQPLVMLPFSNDQGLIARVFTEKKVGIEIPRNEEDGVYTRKSVAETLRLVIAEEGGKIYRKKTNELRVLFADEQLHDQYIHKFVEFLENHRQVSNH
ncbi:putative UDP-rhamnose:rhamnosyltransferase 1 isoform X1 [Mangifera indica]|uniref:putative UDP-rhamnose:rhamnosyltransferase 1 isoform X1 n=1 Tax=Mangifera indica TaxID=29780 RepID=UPI001CFB34A2|nr:putative UDP-rhamnose:rhamnosyltransferase 1 isoform X1 [Mangifera indica]